MSLDLCPQPSLTFFHGVLVGQLSIILICALFLKYVVFEDPVEARKRAQSRPKQRKRRRQPKKPAAAAEKSPAVLQALAYDIASHPRESLDWLNVLIAQLLAAYRSVLSAETEGGAVLLEEMLNSRSSSETRAGLSLISLDYVNVDAVDAGSSFPVLSDARVRPSSSGDSGGVQIDIDVSFSDHIVVAVSTAVIVNLPRPRFAVLPANLTLIVEKFTGTLSLDVRADGVQLSLDPDFGLDISMSTLLGSRSKLENVPKVEQLILARIRSYIQQRLVLPYGFIHIALPSLTPRKDKSLDAARDTIATLNIDETKSELLGSPRSDAWDTPQTHSRVASIEIS